MSMRDLAVSLGFMVGCCAASQITRKLTRNVFNDGLVPILIKEAIAAAELCACGFELTIVGEHFGVGAYALCLFALSVWWSQSWTDVSACPYTHMEEWMNGNMSIREVVLRTWAELMGGCCVYRIVQVYWYLELASTHKNKAFEECSADLKVDPYVGAAIEGIATLLCRITTKTLSDKHARNGTVIDCFIATSLVVAAANYSGGYFNPVLATALKWGCTGHTNLEHIIVYWIGACTGALLSVPVYRTKIVQNIVAKIKVD